MEIISFLQSLIVENSVRKVDDLWHVPMVIDPTPRSSTTHSPFQPNVEKYGNTTKVMSLTPSLTDFNFTPYPIFPKRKVLFVHIRMVKTGQLSERSLNFCLAGVTLDT